MPFDQYSFAPSERRPHVPVELGPLGLLPEKQDSIDEAVLGALQRLQDADLTREKRSLVRHHPEKALFIHVLERELKRFLSLPVLVPERKYEFTPALWVDELWHELIINTPKYRSLCDQVFGAYLDHCPNPLGDERDLVRTVGEVADYTRTTLVEYYGSLASTIWATDVSSPCHPTPCGPCRSGLRGGFLDWGS
jgi:hypothetical protein